MRAIDLMPGLMPALATVEGGKEIGLRRVILGRNALERLPAQVVLVAGGGPIVTLEDATPMRRNGEDLKELVNRQLAAVGKVRRIVLGPPDGRVHADAAVLEEASRAVAGAGCVVTVGSGTITDIGKHACHENGGTPLVAVQTAASVNGYADDMAVILREGVKRTVPSVWPRVVVIDTDVLIDAPAELTRSGYAEMMAMFTAPADWGLADVMGVDSSYQQTVVDLFRPEGERLLAAAPDIAAGDGAAVELLAELLTSSGMAMGVAGRTAPLSGTEHLISHLLDMSGVAQGLPLGLHGTQVGVAAVVAATIWEWLFEDFDLEVLPSVVPDEEEARRQVESAFARLDGDGSAAAECWIDYRVKLSGWRDRTDQGDRSLGWRPAIDGFRALLAEPRQMVAALRSVGAPTRFSELDPPVDPDRARWAVASCHLMRSRFTVVDLAALSGRWTSEQVEDILERAGRWGGGL